MADFDYGNARLRAMKSRLLSRQALESLAETGSIQGLLTALTNTAYRQAVEAALVRLSDMACLAEALHRDLVATLGNAGAFFSGAAAELAGVALRRFDLHNVKTILRGLAGQISANEMLANTLPVAGLRPADLAELARTANVREAIDVVATWRLPLAMPLLELRAQRPGAELFEMEVALERWHISHAMGVAIERGVAVLGEALALEADVTNIMTALRLVGAPDAARFLRQRFGADDATPLFVGPGRVTRALLARAAGQDSISAAIDVLAETPYQGSLATALDRYKTTGRLSVFERALTKEQWQHAAGLILRDPLGIGVLLGYIALKTNEVANLRSIAQGLVLGQKPDRIRAELMIIDLQ